MRLEDYDTKELEEELIRRRFAKNTQKLTERYANLSDVDKINIIDELYEYCLNDILFMLNNEEYPRDFDHYAMEELFSKVLGDNVWDVINKAIK
jgi:hypothetical protein